VIIRPGPEGGAFAGDGKHGSMFPSPGRVRSRNDMALSRNDPAKKSSQYCVPSINNDCAPFRENGG
jgi:hypothetical protein